MKFYRDGQIFDTTKSEYLLTYPSEQSDHWGNITTLNNHVYLTPNGKFFAVEECRSRRFWGKYSLSHEIILLSPTCILSEARRCGILDNLSKKTIDKLEGLLEEA